MGFQPVVDLELVIERMSYYIAPHPAAPQLPYGQEGRQGIVCQIATRSGQKRALKYFRPTYRKPALVALADKLDAFAHLPGLSVCRRRVMTPQRDPELLRQYPDLVYGILMPWVDSPTWMQAMEEQRALTPEQCLAIARALAETLTAMEQNELAHCDLSAPNVLLPQLMHEDLHGSSGIELVDVEQMFGPGFKQPEVMVGGSPGYAHRTAAAGLWNGNADRFAGAVLVAEMLGWWDERVRTASWGESYFDPIEMQQDTPRYRLLREVLRARWGVEELFDRAWQSRDLEECPTFGEWVLALPERAARTQPFKRSPEIFQLLLQAGQYARTRKKLEARGLYRQALFLMTPDDPLREKVIASLAELGVYYKTGQNASAPATPTTKQTETVTATPTRTTKTTAPAWRVTKAERVAAQRAHKAGPPARTRYVYPAILGVILLAIIITVIIGLQPCNWLDVPLRLSSCVYAIGQNDSPVVSTALAPNGSTLVMSSSNGDVNLRNVLTGRVIKTLSGHKAPVAIVAFSADGHFFATGSEDWSIKIWDATTGAEVVTLSGHTGAIITLAFSPNGKTLITGAADRTVRLWQLPSGNPIPPTISLTSSVTGVAFSPNGQLAAASTRDGKVKVWHLVDQSTLTEEAQNIADPQGIKSLAFTPDSKSLATADVDGNIRIWNAATGLYSQFAATNPLTTLTGHTAEVTTLAFSPDGTRLASGSSDKSVRLWGTDTWSPLRVLPMDSAVVPNLTFSMDGLLASGATTGVARIWEVR